MRRGKHSKFCRLSAFLLAVVLCLTLAVPAMAADDATASSIQLAKTEGTVSATNSAGRSVSLIKNLRLFSGYHVATEAKSYAWLNLDSAKLLKEDASSNVEVRKSGKKLEVLLSSGNLYFNVTEPLDDDETLNIRTSTTLTGVRGTCGWVEVIDRWNTEVYILEGKVECAVTDPVSGENKLTTISAGEMATFTVLTGGAHAPDGVEITKKRCDVDDVPGYVLVELAGDRPLCDEIRDASGLDILGELSRNGDPAAEAQRRLEEDEAAAARRLASIAASERAQANNVESAPNTPASGELNMVGTWGWRYDESTKTLHIEGSGAMSNYSYRGNTPPWYEQYRQEIESVVIHPGITRIGGYAFEHCTRLASVTIPDSVSSIEPWAFYECTGLTDVYYGGSETQWRAISISASDKYNLSLATIHYAVSDGAPNTAGEWSWRYDEAAKTLYIEGSGAMDDFANRSDAPWYEYREQMESVVISGGITRIGNNAFAYCSNLTSVSIPNSVTSIGDNTFYHCNSLTSVTIPAGVTSIGSAAFDYCYNLTSVSIPDSVTSIGDYAFYDCHSLTSVTIPGSVTSIEDYTFTECIGLTSVTIQNGVTSIGVRAFQGCTSLTGVTIPDSVTTIRYDAFYGCYGMLDVHYGGDGAQWSAISIESGNDYLTDATIHYNSR